MMLAYNSFNEIHFLMVIETKRRLGKARNKRHRQSLFIEDFYLFHQPWITIEYVSIVKSCSNQLTLIISTLLFVTLLSQKKSNKTLVIVFN